MSATDREDVGKQEADSPQCSQEMLELVLPLGGGEVAALESAAKQRGLTTGGLLRCLIADFLGRETRRRAGRRA